MKTNDKKSASKKENTAEKATKKTTPAKEEVKENKQEIPANPLDALIENIKADKALLMLQEEKLTECKKAKSDILSRLKSHKSDLKVFLKYATDQQKQEIESLGFGTEKTESNMNEVAQITLDIMTQKKKLTNNELYEAYSKVVSDKKELPEKYTFFNIKIRGLFNRGLLTRIKGSEESSSREDVITLTGGDN